MGDSGVDADYQVEVGDDGGSVGEVFNLPGQIDDGQRACRQFLSGRALLQRIERDARQASQFGQSVQSDGALAIAGVFRIAGPYQADAQPGGSEPLCPSICLRGVGPEVRYDGSSRSMPIQEEVEYCAWVSVSLVTAVVQ